MSTRARIEEFRVGLKKPPTLAPTHGAQAASQRVSLLFIYYFLLIKNKNNNKYTPGWMDWIEIPLHEFAAYLVELCPSHSPSVNVKEGTFHPIIPTDRFKLFQTSALCIGKAGVDVVQGFDAIRMSDGRGCSARNKLPAVPPQDFQIAIAADNRCWRTLTSSRQINSRNCVAKPTGNASCSLPYEVCI